MTLPTNFIARPYRGVSVQRWQGRLELEAVQNSLIGREAYRRTEFLVLRNDDQVALMRLMKASAEPLFSPIVGLDWLAGPDDCTYLESPDVDTGNATALAGAARASGRDCRAYVVEGMYHHVNFIYDPRPLRISVPEVVPPEPPKLLEMARQVLRFDEDLPPVELVFDPVDFRELARQNPAPHYLLPCRGSGLELPGQVSFLDERPARQDWLLIGCERSRQFHEWFYGSQPPRVELCPRILSSSIGPTLLKCCLLERGLQQDGNRVIVPWGASLKEVQEALHRLANSPNVAVD